MLILEPELSMSRVVNLMMMARSQMPHTSSKQVICTTENQALMHKMGREQQAIMDRINRQLSLYRRQWVLKSMASPAIPPSTSVASWEPTAQVPKWVSTRTHLRFRLYRRSLCRLRRKVEKVVVVVPETPCNYQEVQRKAWSSVSAVGTSATGIVIISVILRTSKILISFISFKREIRTIGHW